MPSVTPQSAAVFWGGTYREEEDEGTDPLVMHAQDSFFIPSSLDNPPPDGLEDAFWVIPLKGDEYTHTNTYTAEQCRLWSTATVFRKVRPMDYSRLGRILGLTMRGPRKSLGRPPNADAKYGEFAEQFAKAVLKNAEYLELLGHPATAPVGEAVVKDQLSDLYVGVSVVPGAPLTQTSTGMALAYFARDHWNRMFLEDPQHEPCTDMHKLNVELRDFIRDVTQGQQQDRHYKADRARKRQENSTDYVTSTTDPSLSERESGHDTDRRLTHFGGGSRLRQKRSQQPIELSSPESFGREQSSREHLVEQETNEEETERSLDDARLGSHALGLRRSSAPISGGSCSNPASPDFAPNSSCPPSLTHRDGGRPDSHTRRVRPSHNPREVWDSLDGIGTDITLVSGAEAAGGVDSAYGRSSDRNGPSGSSGIASHLPYTADWVRPHTADGVRPHTADWIRQATSSCTQADSTREPADTAVRPLHTPLKQERAESPVRPPDNSPPCQGRAESPAIPRTPYPPHTPLPQRMADPQRPHFTPTPPCQGRAGSPLIPHTPHPSPFSPTPPPGMFLSHRPHPSPLRLEHPSTNLGHGPTA